MTSAKLLVLIYYNITMLYNLAEDDFLLLFKFLWISVWKTLKKKTFILLRLINRLRFKRMSVMSFEQTKFKKKTPLAQFSANLSNVKSLFFKTWRTASFYIFEEKSNSLHPKEPMFVYKIVWNAWKLHTTHNLKRIATSTLTWCMSTCKSKYFSSFTFKIWHFPLIY